MSINSAMSINPVFPGFAWAQDFTIDPAALPVDALVRIDLRAGGQTPRPPITVSFTRPAPEVLRLSLTPQQTAGLRAPGTLTGDLVMRVGLVDFALNLRLILPLADSLTAPLP